ncbi:glycoside hydrolase family 3 N-terminal domain-containing protein [Defluviimonas sp. D31]|uniref:glycoside hydrolase family 3 N-terminal domain-containing protein n=1 Tax=Defluviimonas sp. D31 TaxID=3083253 RepID=UPI00296FC608|nr:glycoside hydrolase family 3 N-terminal domain-containing protein [Defluviimonas sp. D31]MDW4548600.1 glycoside hydrolase family 3 N-terminal domain-containing protein [Defluviimonas sp. D31]
MANSATILGCEGSRLGAGEAEFFREADPWGFILFSRNVDSPDQLRRLTGDLRAAVGREAPILVDQEGGRVQRLGAPHWREWLPPMDQVARTTPEAMERGIYLRYRLIAAELRAVGIDANCAPTADIAGSDTHPFLKNRCFGTDAETVAKAARASAEGLLRGGVLPVVKHLPGHGRAVVDSHLQLPRVGAAIDELDATDFVPFRALSDLPMAMTAHIVFDVLDPERPATASADAVTFIRDGIGFGGLLMTDDLSMEALTGTLADRAAAGIAAGCDIALYCKGIRAEAEAVVVASGRLSSAAAARADKALACRRSPDAIDTALLEAELEALLMGQVHG